MALSPFTSCQEIIAKKKSVVNAYDVGDTPRTFQFKKDDSYGAIFWYNNAMKYLRYVLTTLLVALLFGGYFTYLTLNGEIDKNPVSSAILAVARPYPALTSPKTVTMTCDYHGKNVTLSETLYGSLDSYYQTDPNKKSIYRHNEEKDFVFSSPKDGVVKDVAAKILALGAENGLDRDQTLDLGACLLQSIPYDNEKAQKILSPDFAKYPVAEVIPRYPYETLYDFTGICTDKTFLGAIVFSEMGYKTAIMTFDADKHMSLGVGVTDGYGSYGTQYGIMELTGGGFLVGDIPELSSGVGVAINNFQTLPKLSNDSIVPAEQVRLGNPSDVIPVSDGGIYDRIVQRTAIRKKLEDTKPELDLLKNAYQAAQAVLAQSEANLKSAESAYTAVPSNASNKTYLKVYDTYKNDYNTAQAKITSYNQMVNLYNGYVEQYKQF